MLELRFIRENLSLVKEKTELRGIKDSRIEEFEAIDTKRRQLLGELAQLKDQQLRLVLCQSLPYLMLKLRFLARQDLIPHLKKW